MAILPRYNRSPFVNFDGRSKPVELQKSVSEEEFEKSTYYYAMHDFDGSTGFDIPSRLTKKDRQYLTQIANVIHEQWKKATQ